MVFVALLGLCAAIVLFAMLRNRGGGRDAASASVARGEIDAWIEEALARELGARTPLGSDAVLGALRGDPEPEAVTAIEGAVRSVEIKYARLPHDRDVEVRAQITFEDGTSSTGVRGFAQDKLPQAVRDEFARTGSSYVFRAWHLPWSGPDRGWV